MKKIVTLKIDDKDFKAEKGITILEASKQLGIIIPTLCYHEGLEPYGACRLCSVEIKKNGKSRIVAACSYPIDEGLDVRTRSARLDKIRKTLIELAAVRAGEDVGGEMRALAGKYNANLSRFKVKVPIEPTKCILCGLCVRRCVEANWDSAIGFIGRGIDRRVVLFPEKSGSCLRCNYCNVVCPTGRISSVGPDPPFPNLDDVLAGRR